VTAEHGIDLARLTIEIVEHTHYEDGPAFAQALQCIRSLGPRIALDDVGLGHSNYRRMLDADADFLKIDRYLVHGSGNDPHRRAVVESIAQLARRLGAQAIAEGVETADDLHSLKDSGIDLAQGYLLGRPMTADELRTSGWLSRNSHCSVA
jgi:EAL domain-containing protein (putative c-di-GMP-specific phosphodiesterase class I)